LNQYKTHVAVTEKFTIITNILNAVAQFQLEFCKSCFNIPQIKIITTIFRTTSHPFRYEVCQIIKAQIFLNITSDLLS